MARYSVGWYTAPTETLFVVKYSYSSSRATGVSIELRYHTSSNVVTNANILPSKPTPGTDRNGEIKQS